MVFRHPALLAPESALWALPSVAISSAQVASVCHKPARISKPLKKKYLLACLPARYKYSCPDCFSLAGFEVTTIGRI
jgi:hypothetical protein